MTSKKNTNKALFSSVIALILCCSMLVGTTFAWFTDSVESGRNTIQSGNLDVELLYSFDGTNWITVDSDTELFDDEALWEPGYTQVVYLKVKNAGSLALKYDLTLDVDKELPGVNMAGETFNLSEHLWYGVLTSNDFGALKDRVTAAEKALTQLSEIMSSGSVDISGGQENLGNGGGQQIGAAAVTRSLLAGEENVTAIVITMPGSVGNEANHNGETVPSVSFGINLVATQQDYEKDSFGDDYDADLSLGGDSVGFDPTKYYVSTWYGGPYYMDSNKSIVYETTMKFVDDTVEFDHTGFVGPLDAPDDPAQPFITYDGVKYYERTGMGGWTYDYVVIGSMILATNEYYSHSLCFQILPNGNLQTLIIDDTGACDEYCHTGDIFVPSDSSKIYDPTSPR